MWEALLLGVLVFVVLAVISRLFESTFNFVLALTIVLWWGPPLIWLLERGRGMTFSEALVGIVATVVWFVVATLIASTIGAALRFCGLWREPLG